ncbi:hypothetical protein J1N09_14605 [Aureitalea sp. L0-47]|nr:hypothetical protein [Aureitalea sp. L0-47]
MTKKTLKYRTTDKKKASLISGVLLTLILVSTPFLFYLYRIVPSDTAEWDTLFGTVRTNGFNTVQGYIYTLFTKLTFVLLTAIWFVTSRNWWKYAILVPLTMFLFQLSGVINQNIQYIDEYDFWYSLPVILPIIFFLIYISYRLGKRRAAEAEALKEQVDEEISNIFGDNL